MCVCRHVFACAFVCVFRDCRPSSGDTNLIGFLKRFILSYMTECFALCICAPCVFLWKPEEGVGSCGPEVEKVTLCLWDQLLQSLRKLVPDSSQGIHFLLAGYWLHFPELADHQEGWLNLPNPECDQGPSLQCTEMIVWPGRRTCSGTAPFPPFSGL